MTLKLMNRKNIEIYLNNNLGFKWKTDNITWVKGYAFDKENNYLFESNLIDYFKSVYSIKIFHERFNSLNGNLTVVTQKDNKLFAAVDRIRSIPLFYALENDVFYLTDAPHWIIKKLNKLEFERLFVDEFLQTGYVTLNNTLYPKIFQLEAGHILVFDKNTSKLKINKYNNINDHEISEKSNQELIDLLDEIHKSIFNRLIRSLEGKTVVIPLSSGYDSSLIALMLKRMGYENVICYTYGNGSYWEINQSKEVADYLKYPWFFINYDRKKWRKWHKSNIRKEFFEYSGNLCSIPCIQDFPAVWELKKKQIIPLNSVFVPGHSGDFLAGSHLPQSFINKNYISKSDLIQGIYNRHYHLRKKSKFENLFKNRINCYLEKKDKFDSETASKIFEYWDLQERQSKFIVNSVRVYEFFGFEWRLPLWDLELITFWSKIKMKDKINRILYLEYAKEYQKLPVSNSNNIIKKVNEKKSNSIKKILINILFKRSNIDSIRMYWKHKLAWYGIVNFYKFILFISLGAVNINSIIAKIYIKELKVKQK